MADYTVTGTDKAAWAKALAAATVDTVTFDRHAGVIRVHLDAGTTAVFFTTDGTAPTVNGAHTYRVRGTAGDWTEVPVTGEARRTGLAVKLISSGAVTYSVEASP